MQHQRRLDLAAVDAVPPLKLGEHPLRMPEARPARLHHEHVGGTRSSRATIPIISSLPPCELTMTSLRTPARLTESPSSVHASIATWAGSDKRAGGPDMFVRFANRLDRQAAHVEIVGEHLCCGRQHAVGDQRVGADGKMRPVLLGRGGRQDRDRRIGIDRGKLARPVFAPAEPPASRSLHPPKNCFTPESQTGPTAIASISTLNSGRAKPETIISVEAGSGSVKSRSRTAM